ncbi:thioredoxin family protein [Desulfobacula sp.]
MEIDIDTQRTLATDYMVQSIPTLIIFQDGREVRRLVGLQSEAVLEKNLNEALENR